MGKARRTAMICVLLCLCCLLSGCRESVLQTVHTSACEMLENGEECSAVFVGSRYIAVKVSKELTEILNPSDWKRTTAAATATQYCSVTLPIAILEFYEGNLLCVTMSETNEQEWYVGKTDVHAQLEQYKQRHGIYVAPEVIDFVAVCR